MGRLCSFHGPWDESSYAVLQHGRQVRAHDSFAVQELQVWLDGTRSGPGAPYGGWTLHEDLVSVPRLSKLSAMLDGLPEVTLRLGPSVVYPPGVWDALGAAAIACSWKTELEPTLVVTKSSFRPRKTRLHEVRRAESAGAKVVAFDAKKGVEFLAAQKERSGYPFDYDAWKWAEQCRVWPDNFRTYASVIDGEPQAVMLEAEMTMGRIALSWHQTQQARALGCTDQLVYERLMAAFDEQSHLEFVELGLGTMAGLVTFKEGFGAVAYMRASLSK